MRYISLFSGIEAASVAWAPLGWEALAFSEIDPFCNAVLERRFPSVPNLGDISEIDWREWRGKADVVIGGSPCQSFSVAGKRTGLSGPSGLMWEFIRAVSEIRPRWFVWENVPGALSAEDGRAFWELLRHLDAIGYGLAWDVLDAQFFALAQRRERVFLVGRLGDVEGACQVLFEPEGLQGPRQPSKEKRKELAALARAGARGADCAGFCAAAGASAGGIGYADGLAPTVRSAAQAPSVVYGISGNAIGRSESAGGNGPGFCDPDENGGYTLTATDRHAVAYSMRMRSGRGGGGKGPLVQRELSGTLATRNDQTLFQPGGLLCLGGTQANASVSGEVAGTLTARSCSDAPLVCFSTNRRGEARLHGGDGATTGAIPASQSGTQMHGVAGGGPGGYVVRRLMPVECERLQGFPDGWTLIPYRGRPADECPDTPRYRAIGNSMPVTVIRWIGERISSADGG